MSGGGGGVSVEGVGDVSGGGDSVSVEGWEM